MECLLTGPSLYRIWLEFIYLRTVSSWFKGITSLVWWKYKRRRHFQNIFQASSYSSPFTVRHSSYSASLVRFIWLLPHRCHTQKVSTWFPATALKCNTLFILSIQTFLSIRFNYFILIPSSFSSANTSNFVELNYPNITDFVLFPRYLFSTSLKGILQQNPNTFTSSV